MTDAASTMAPESTTMLPQVEKAYKHAVAKEDLQLFMVAVVLIFIWVLPCVSPFRRCCETRFHCIFPIITMVNFIIFMGAISHFKLVSVNSVFFGMVGVLEVALNQIENILMAMLALVGGFVMWKFKDRVFDALGVHGASQLLGDWRDWATCWSMQRFRPIELFLWKVDGLPSTKLTSKNDVYGEVFYGYNMAMRTRVHQNAGTSCLFRESVQLNFDPFDSSEMMHIVIKNQDLVGSTEIARLTLGAMQIYRLESTQPPQIEGSKMPGTGTAGNAASRTRWQAEQFHALDLIPVGKLWLRFSPVLKAPEDEERGWFTSMMSQGARRSYHRGSLVIHQGDTPNEQPPAR